MKRQRANTRLITLGVLIMLAVVLILVGRSTLSPLISGLMVPLQPITRLVNGGAEAVEELSTEQQPSYEELLEENQEYERLIAQMQAEIAQLREVERAYDRVSALANYARDNPDQGVVTATVIGRDTSSYLRSIIINRGTRDGIQVGDAVIAGAREGSTRGGAFVGIVEEVSANSAWVRLAIDPSSTVNARMQGSRAEGTVVGLVQGGLLMDFIPQEEVLTQGDTVVTSGLGGTLPADIVIGTVTNIRRQQAALFQQVDLAPAVDFNELEIVSVVTTFQPVDTTLFDDLVAPEEEDTP